MTKKKEGNRTERMKPNKSERNKTDNKIIERKKEKQEAGGSKRIVKYAVGKDFTRFLFSKSRTI